MIILISHLSPAILVRVSHQPPHFFPGRVKPEGPHRHLQLLGVDAPCAVCVEQVEGLAQLGALVVGEVVGCLMVGVVGRERREVFLAWVESFQRRARGCRAASSASA
jgi:hypothetical protein